MADAILIVIALALLSTLGGKWLLDAAPAPMNRTCKCPACCYASAMAWEREQSLREAYAQRRTPEAQAINAITADRRGR